MRKLDTTPITDTVGMPVKAGVWEHLQLAYQEAINALALNLIQNYQINTPYILYGCVNTGSGLNYIISAGAIFYNGEVFLVDPIAFTAPGGQVAVASIVQTFYINSDRGDPIQFTNGINYNVLQVRKIVYGSGASGSTIFDFGTEEQTTIPLINIQVPTLGSSYTVGFDEDSAIFFASATVSTTIGFDFTNAVPGSVCRLKWTWGGGLTLTVTPGSGNTAYQEGGDITRAAGHTNTMYFIYLGKNEAGNNEVGYSISQVV